MTQYYSVLVVVGATVLLCGIFSGFIKDRSILSEQLIALLVGIGLGPAFLDVLSPFEWGEWTEIVEETARVTLAIGLMAIALRLPTGYIGRHWRELAMLIGLVMPLMWLAGSVVIYVFAGSSMAIAMLIGAVITPTDPVVASSIVTSKLAKKAVPDRVRHLISAESGLNDGLAYPIVMLPILLLTGPAGDAFSHWLIHTLPWEIGAAVVLGLVLGHGTGRLLRWAEKKKLVEDVGFLSVTIALALATLGAGKLIGVDGILAVFVAGMAFDKDASGTERSEEANIQETVNQFFSIPVFTLFGMVVPVAQWLALGWRGPAIAVGVLLLRRLPALAALQRGLPSLQGRADVVFAGWFGPIGVSALLYAMLALKHTGNDMAWIIGSLVICASIAVHGMSATPLTKAYGKRAST